MRKLTPRQARFVDEYLIDLNATQAAIRAGYSVKTAGWIGLQLLRKTHVRAAIEEAKHAREARTQITQDRVLREIARVGFFDIRKLVNNDGTPRPLKDLDDDTAAALNGLDVVQIGNAEKGVGQVLKYKIADKNKALEHLARHLGMFNDRVSGDLAVMITRKVISARADDDGA